MGAEEKKGAKRRLEETGPGTTMTINIAESFASADLRLLQAPEEVIKAVTAGDSVRLVGSSRDQRAVLVTASSTYELCKVETSNMMLLVPPSRSDEDRATAIGNVGFHYEVKRAQPRFEELQRLLTVQDETQGLTLEELEMQVQGSREEIRAKLREMKAMEVDGRWYMAGDGRVLQPVLEQVLTEALVQGLSLDKLSVEECCRLLSGEVRPLLVRQCLQVYGTPCTQEDSSGEGWYRLDLDEVARVKAHQVFRKGLQRPQKAVWGKAAFQLEWQAAMPCQHQLHEALLRGIAVSEERGQEACWRYLPADELDLHPELRLRSLFEARKTWTLQDIEPYLREVLPEQVGLEDFLLRHARLNEAADGGATLYSAK